MAIHSRTFAWKIPWTEEPGGLQSMGSLESDTTEWLHFHFSLSCIGEGNGNPFQFLAWRIPGTGQPGRLPSVGSRRVGHDWSDLAAAAACGAKILPFQPSPLRHKLGWKVKVKPLSRVRLFATPVDCSSPGSSVHGLPFPSPGDLPDPGIEHRSPALQADSLLSEPPGKPQRVL